MILSENIGYIISPEDLSILGNYLSEVEKRSHGACLNQKGKILKCLNYLKKPIMEITMIDIVDYFKCDIDISDLKLNSKESHRSYLKSFFYYVQSILLDQGIVYNTPVPIQKVYNFTKRTNDFKKISEQEEDVFSIKELQEILDQSKINRYRDFIMYGIVISTGMRISECLTIKIENINLTECYIETGMEKDARKSDKALLFFFPRGFKPYLENYLLVLGKKNGWLFPGRNNLPISKTGLRKYCNKHYRVKYTKFHAFRRTLITRRMKDKGCDLLISEMLMNHAPSSVEGKHYVKLSIKEKREYYDKNFPFNDITYF